MNRTFDAREIDEMREDMRHNPGKSGLSIVAELHACSPDEVLTALGLTAWPDEPPQKESDAPKRRRYVDSKIKEAAVNAMLDGTDSYATVAERYGVSVSSLYGWVQRSVQQKVTTKEKPMESKKKSNASGAAAAHSGKLGELRAGLDGLGVFVSAFIDTGMLDDTAIERLTLWAKEAKAFVAGAEYMEGRK